MSLQEKIQQCNQDIEDLKNEIQGIAQEADENAQPLPQVGNAKKIGVAQFSSKVRKQLKGHFGKIYAMHWGSDSRHLVSASQDGKLLIWNGMTTNKIQAIPLRSSWVMTCAYSPSGSLVACGGLDNLCTVYQLPDKKGGAGAGYDAKCKSWELAQHEGYLSCCRFVDDTHIITSSGDSTCIYWDINSNVPLSIFSDHTGDVMSVALPSEGKSSYFVSGSCDATCKLWDYKVKKSCVMTFRGHESDINSVSFFPDGQAFATGSDDSSCRLFDLRTYRQANVYKHEKILCGITSVAVSKGGRYLFSGYDDYNGYVWDTVHGSKIGDMALHQNRVSCLGVSPDGQAVCLGSWDAVLSIWA